MYAYRLLDALKIDVNDGVVRLSAVHYNTEEEIDKCIKALDENPFVYTNQRQSFELEIFFFLLC